MLPAITARHLHLAIDVDLVAEGYDIGIRGGVIEDTSLIARRVCALPLVLVATPAYLRRAGVPASPEDLRTHHCAGIRFTSGQALAWRFVPPRGQPIEITPQPALTTNDPESLVDLALADAGIVQCALHHALPHLRRGSLKLLLPGTHDPGHRETVVHYPHRQYLAPRVRVVVDALLAHLGAEPDPQATMADVLTANPACAAGTPQTGRRSATGKRYSGLLSPPLLSC